MNQHAPIYIVSSPNPGAGKTLLARLLIQFLRSNDRPAVGFDLNPRAPALTGYFPNLVRTIDIADTTGQVALFDQLLSDETSTKVVDLGYAEYEQFFTVMGEINFADEARQRLIEPVVLFIADGEPKTIGAYAALRSQLSSASLVPLHNEAVDFLFSKADFPSRPAACGAIRIPRFPASAQNVVGAYFDHPGDSTEVQNWIGEIFNGFRELELRLLMVKLESSLSGAWRQPRRRTKRARQ